jgi:UDP-N-acetyl-D-galactosamine dehydrogenase
MDDKKPFHLAILGLGYVGLPLAVEFAKKYPVVGFDINPERVKGLQSGNDYTLEVSREQLTGVLKKQPDCTPGLWITGQLEDLRSNNIYIITVPTPVDAYNRPDLTALLKASETAGRVLKKGDIVIYESTVYPGVTEEKCIPVLEKISGLQFNKDFFAGYSPERINPGDTAHSVTKIKKVTSGSTAAAAQTIDALYASIISAGTHLAPSIKVAEASKVIENAQRDINIAFMNELAKIFNLLQIDTQEVLAAASTKWNFMPFKPGLVGGHCIGVGPYYLAQKALEVGYYPEIILAGRRLNEGMGAYVAGEVIKLMVKKNIPVAGSKALVLGITFKENCPDIRNTKVMGIIQHLQEYHMQVDVYDPWANPQEVKDEYGVNLIQELPEGNTYHAVVLAVAHRQFGYETIQKFCHQQCVLFDVKAHLGKELVDARL